MRDLKVLPTPKPVVDAASALMEAVFAAEAVPEPDIADLVAGGSRFEQDPGYQAWSDAWWKVRLAKIDLAVEIARAERRRLAGAR